jgi:hypothetical protein
VIKDVKDKIGETNKLNDLLLKEIDKLKAESKKLERDGKRQDEMFNDAGMNRSMMQVSNSNHTFGVNRSMIGDRGKADEYLIGLEDKLNYENNSDHEVKNKNHLIFFICIFSIEKIAQLTFLRKMKKTCWKTQ